MHFENLFVLGRPAAGKSEFIDFMKNCDPNKRLEKFHVAPFDRVDDYLFLRELADNENIMEKLGVPKVVTKLTSDGIVAMNELFFLFVTEKMNLIFNQKYLPQPDLYKSKTILIEFSRGINRYGYRHSISGLDKGILSRGSIIYIKASYEESMRRNEARYQEKMKYSILAHKCPEEAMERFYKTDDWDELTGGKESGMLDINGIEIPFVTMNNEPESKDDAVMEERYYNALSTCFELWQKKQRS
jgi:hypothetical protein